MILLNLNSTTNLVYCTPLEKLSVVPSYYYFRFESRQTKSVVQFTIADTSNSKRFQKFIVNAVQLFANQKEGFWNYIIKPTSQNNGIDPNTDICETGMMYLSSNNIFTPTKYEDQNNTYKTYSK